MKNNQSPVLPALLAADEPAAFTLENETADGPCLIVCDHASNAVPRSLAGLGLSRDDLARHIAWDIGARELSLAMAKRLKARCVLANYSRLVIDLNRAPGHPGSVLEVSDHTSVPGNAGLTPAMLALRQEALFNPYHDEIRRQTARIEAMGKKPFIIAIHSFTPEMNGVKRPWHIGVLWSRNGLVAQPLIRVLREDNPQLVIGDNEPYSAKEGPEFNNTIEVHAESRGFPSIMIEFRQDEVADARGVENMAGIFMRALDKIGIHSFS